MKHNEILQALRSASFGWPSTIVPMHDPETGLPILGVYAFAQEEDVDDALDRLTDVLLDCSVPAGEWVHWVAIAGKEEAALRAAHLPAVAEFYPSAFGGEETTPRRERKSSG